MNSLSKKGLILFLVLTNGNPEDVAAIDFEKEIEPVLERVCGECHGPEKQKADLRFDTLSPDFLKGGDADTWHDALDQINLGEMPPTKAKHQLTAGERQALTEWLNDSLNAVAAAKRNVGGRVNSRRLTRYEYANTMRDLLGIEYDFSRELPPEPTSPEGFLNNGRTLEMSPTQIETYLAVARQALDIAIVTGEKPEVFSVNASASAIGRLPKKKDGGAVPVNPEFVLDVPDFPRSGEFEITVTASSKVPEGHGYPKLEVWLGCVPGIIHVPRKMVGEVSVKAPQDNPETFTFRGRMEDFPQAGRTRFGKNIDFHGVIVMLDFFDAEGNELHYPHKRYVSPPPKPKKKGDPVPPLPSPPTKPFPDIEIESVHFVAPSLTSWPPPSHLALLNPDNTNYKETKRARADLEAFMSRAFRRPVSGKDIDPYLQLFEKIRPLSESYPEAMKETFASVLVSPRFLHLIDTRDNFALAERLSYLLWSTAPDQRLLTLAKQKKLRNPDTLADETNRLMNDPRSSEFINRFSDQWFDLDALNRVAVNPEFFPEFDNELKTAMQTETREYFGEILREDLSCLELIDSNWTMVNRALATHYGLGHRPRGPDFERVKLAKEDRRGGILGQGAFLLSNSNGEASHPIKRAVWILDRLLDSPPAPPPPDVPELDPEQADLAGLTLKDQLAAHRKKESCRSCHENIDPWGIALENYDAIGLFRTVAPLRSGEKTSRDHSPPKLDPVTKLPHGETLNGADDLKAFLLKEKRQHLAQSIVKRLATYALGRSLDLSDRETIEALTERFQSNDFRLRGLIVDLVNSDLFQHSSARS